MFLFHLHAALHVIHDAEEGVRSSISHQQKVKVAPDEEPDPDLAGAAQGHPWPWGFVSQECWHQAACALHCCK